MNDLRKNWKMEDIMAEKSIRALIEQYKNGTTGGSMIDDIVFKMVDLVADSRAVMEKVDHARAAEYTKEDMQTIMTIVQGMMVDMGVSRFALTPEVYQDIPDKSFVEIGIHKGNYYAEMHEHDPARAN